MTKTNNIFKKTTGRFKKTISIAAAAVMTMTTAASFSVFADNTRAVTSANTTVAMVKAQQRYNGHDVIDCSFTADNGFVIPFKYTDGVFETDPSKYDPNMATKSNIFAEASTTYENGAKVQRLSKKCSALADLKTYMQAIPTRLRLHPIR